MFNFKKLFFKEKKYQPLTEKRVNEVWAKMRPKFEKSLTHNMKKLEKEQREKNKKISEDEYDLKVAEEAYSEYLKDGICFSHEEMKEKYSF